MIPHEPDRERWGRGWGGEALGENITRKDREGVGRRGQQSRYVYAQVEGEEALTLWPLRMSPRARTAMRTDSS